MEADTDCILAAVDIHCSKLEAVLDNAVEEAADHAATATEYSANAAYWAAWAAYSRRAAARLKEKENE